MHKEGICSGLRMVSVRLPSGLRMMNVRLVDVNVMGEVHDI